MCVIPINQHPDQYSGRLISGLIDSADKLSEIRDLCRRVRETQEKLTECIANSIAIAQKIEDDSLAMLCAICSQPRGSHSHDNDECPNLGDGPLFQASKFKELRCEANIVRGLDSFGYECRAACIPGTRNCPEHSQEA